jgi:hypothetical protein
LGSGSQEANVRITGTETINNHTPGDCPLTVNRVALTQSVDLIRGVGLTTTSGINKDGKLFGDGSLLTNLPDLTAGTYSKLATYTVTAGATRSATSGGATRCTMSVTHTQTNAGTHDASATTYDELTFTETASPVGAWSGGYAFTWNAFQHDVAPASSIAFIRMICKVKRTATVGTNNYTITGWKGTQPAPGLGARAISSTTASNVYMISQTNASGEPWTDAEILSAPFGYVLSAWGLASNDGDNPVLTCEEFYIEAWGAGIGVGSVVIGATEGLAGIPPGSEGDVLTIVSGVPAYAASSGGLPTPGAEGDLLGVVSGVWASATITIGFDGGEET